MKRYPVTITTAADGSATGYTPRISGEVHQIEYVPDGTNPYANTVDFTITGEETGINIWTESNIAAAAVRAPRQPTHSQVGAALLYAAGGTPQSARIGLFRDRVKIVLAQGGNAKTGKFHILVEEK